MATLLLRPLPLALGLSLGCATAYTAHTFFHRPQPQFTSLLSAFGPQKLRCDAFPAGTLRGEYARYQDEARTPIVKGGKLNGEAVREFTKGSVAGRFPLLFGLFVWGGRRYGEDVQLPEHERIA